MSAVQPILRSQTITAVKQTRAVNINHGGTFATVIMAIFLTHKVFGSF
jgi:hypothetical protein